MNLPKYKAFRVNSSHHQSICLIDRNFQVGVFILYGLHDVFQSFPCHNFVKQYWPIPKISKIRIEPIQISRRAFVDSQMVENAVFDCFLVKTRFTPSPDAVQNFRIPKDVKELEYNFIPEKCKEFICVYVKIHSSTLVEARLRFQKR